MSTASNSSSGNERFDFDSVGFACLRLDAVIAHSYFAEPEAGARVYAPDDGARELGFEMTATATGGAGAFAGVVKSASTIEAAKLSTVSVAATTTFDAVDLRSESDVQITLVARVLPTGYEDDDELVAYATDGTQRIYLIDVDGDSGLDGLATGDYLAFSAPVPDAWEQATLVVETACDSSSASEGFDLRAVEFTKRATGDPCEPAGPPPVTFVRADASPDGKVQITDGIRILNYLFGGASVDCVDATDADDTGTVEITDGVFVLNFLFSGGKEPPAPGPFACGEDPTADPLGCAVQPPCP